MSHCTPEASGARDTLSGCPDRRPEKHAFDPSDMDSRLCRWCNENVSEHLSGDQYAQRSETAIAESGSSAPPAHSLAEIVERWTNKIAQGECATKHAVTRACEEAHTIGWDAAMRSCGNQIQELRAQVESLANDQNHCLAYEKVNLDIDDAFENFIRQVHGGKVAETSVQWNESRRVFFCGVEQMFSFVMQLTALPDDEAEKGLANIQKQLADFAQRLKEDKA